MLSLLDFKTQFEPCVSVLYSFVSGAQGGKGLVFALQESPGRYPLMANVSVNGAATMRWILDYRYCFRDQSLGNLKMGSAKL